ncbi:MAG: DUF5694 domain-containing protein [Pseudoxanthomonas sp.]
MRRDWLGLLVLLTLAAPALAQQSWVDLARLDEGMVGPRTQVLVLGSPHLSQLPKGVQVSEAQLAPVLDRLAGFKPDLITIEAIPGEICELMRRYRDVYDADDVKTYCPETRQALAATGKDVPAATGEVRRQLKNWPAAPTAAQRRGLAAMLLASGDPASAMVQWWQLPDNERHAGDGLDDGLVKALRERAQRPDESIQVAARLAARLGLQRVYPVDDHASSNLQVDDWKAYGQAVQAAWDKQIPRAKPGWDARDALARQGEMLALYRATNEVPFRQLGVEVDFKAAQQDPSPERYGQRYVTAWDVRNLRMVTNIGSAFMDHPGARVLVVVGSQHKAWFDSLISQMQGVDVVDVDDVLGDAEG